MSKASTHYLRLTDSLGLWLTRYKGGVRVGLQAGDTIVGVGVNRWWFKSWTERYKSIETGKWVVETSKEFGWIGYCHARAHRSSG